MSEDYPASSGGGSDDGGYDGLMDDNDEKELMVECGQRQVTQHNTCAENTTALAGCAAARPLVWLCRRLWRVLTAQQQCFAAARLEV